MPLKENHGDSGLGWLVGAGRLAPPCSVGLFFSPGILHLLSCRPPHQSARHQEAAPELSAESKRLRKQVRKNWSRTVIRWRAGSRRLAEGCQEEPAGNARSALLCLRPGWPQPHQAWPLLQRSSPLPQAHPAQPSKRCSQRGAAPRTGVWSPGPSLRAAAASGVPLVMAGRVGVGEDVLTDERVWNHLPPIRKEGANTSSE